MAIQKSKTLPNGATGSYWKIAKVIVDKNPLMMHAHVILQLYADKAHADVNQPLGFSKPFEFSLTKADLVGDVVATLYAKLKAANYSELAGGTDV